MANFLATFAYSESDAISAFASAMAGRKRENPHPDARPDDGTGVSG
jgi:hypothetical protein